MSHRDLYHGILLAKNSFNHSILNMWFGLGRATSMGLQQFFAYPSGALPTPTHVLLFHLVSVHNRFSAAVLSHLPHEVRLLFSLCLFLSRVTWGLGFGVWGLGFGGW